MDIPTGPRGAADAAPRVLVIIPAYREERSIGAVVRAVREGTGYDVVVVDDGSPDATGERAREAGAVVLTLPCNLGIGGAVQTGFLYAREKGYDALVRIDADGQHEAEDVRHVLAPILSGEADYCVGSRFLGAGDFRSSLPRRFGIGWFCTLLRIFTGYGVTDPTSGFFAMNGRVIDFFARHYPSDYPEADSFVLLHRLGARAVEVPVRMYERSEGKSSITAFRAVYYMVKVTLSLLINMLRRFG
jgi:glycosyltransferase involved in cell wall biosynthesis